MDEQNLKIQIIDNTADYLKKAAEGFQPEDLSKLHPFLIVPVMPRDKARHMGLWLSIPGVATALLSITKPFWFAYTAYVSAAIALPLLGAGLWLGWLAHTEDERFGTVVFHFVLALLSCASALWSVL
jgi:hypothetical protein